MQRPASRRPLLYIFSLAVLLIIGVSFIGTPLIGQLSGPARMSFGSYGGTEIAYFPGNYFANQVDKVSDQYRSVATGVDPQSLAYAVWQEAFRQTVVHVALLDRVRDSDVWVSEELVDKTLVRTGPYVVNGVFSEDRYRTASNQQRENTRRLYREELLKQQFLFDVAAGMRTSSAEQEFFRAMATQQRQFDYVALPFADYPDEQVKAYGRTNAENFRRMRLSRILVSSQQLAQEIQTQLTQSQATFEDLARTHSSDSFAQQGGDLGFRYFYDLARDFDTEEPAGRVFSLRQGDISPVLESAFGFVVFRADSESIQPDFNDEEVLGQVRTYLSTFERGTIEDYYLDSAQALATSSASSGGLRIAAAAAGHTVATTPFFPINFQNLIELYPIFQGSVSPLLSSAAFYDDFFVQAFSVDRGRATGPILLDDGVLVVSLVEERTVEARDLVPLNSYYDSLLAGALQQSLESSIFGSPRLVDRFSESFFRDIFPQS